MRKTILIDGLNLLFRSDFKVGIYTGRKRVSGIINFLYKLKEIRSDYPSSKIIVCWDSGKSGRENILKDYKSKRKKIDEEILEEADELKRNLEEFGIYSISKSGYEGDDLIATLTYFYKGDSRVIIYSSDFDFLQLIDTNVSLFTGKRKITNKNIKSLIGLSQEEFFFKKTIVGDYSDGVSGVPGIGEKGFLNLLKEYGGIEKVLLSPKIRKHLDIVERNYKLLKLQRIEFDLWNIERVLFGNNRRIRKWFFDIGFKRGITDFENFIKVFKVKSRIPRLKKEVRSTTSSYRMMTSP